MLLVCPSRTRHHCRPSDVRQAVAFYLPLWYTHFDLGRRIRSCISASSLMGAIGRHFAFGITSLKHTPFSQWCVLFLIEGFLVFVLVVSPSSCQPNGRNCLEESTLCITSEGVSWPRIRRCLTFCKRVYGFGLALLPQHGSRFRYRGSSKHRQGPWLH